MLHLRAVVTGDKRIQPIAPGPPSPDAGSMDAPMDTTLADPTTPPATSPASLEGHGIFGPPGILFYLATMAAIVIAVDANSRGAFTMAMLALGVWALVAFGWLIRFLGAAWSKRLRLPATHWLRWLVIPVAMGLVFLWTQTDGPSSARLALSRGAMDQAAVEVMAGGSVDRAWIGLYPVQQVERIGNGMRFLIADSGFIDRVGLAYSTDTRPGGIDGTDEYEAIGGGWWSWVQRFN